MRCTWLQTAPRSGLAVALALAALPACLHGQTPGQEQDLHGLKIVKLRPLATPSPFPLDVESGRQHSLEYRKPEAMTPADRELVSAHEAEIVRRALLQGFQLDSPRRETMPDGWQYEQAVCPVFPDHVILLYTRGSSAADTTLFSAVIPRGEGHVRVIPVRRRGYSLFTPASKNDLTINDFNHMVKEEPGGLAPDWLTLGLCYAALAGGRIHAAILPESPEEEHFPMYPPASLTVSRKGGAEVQFMDDTARGKSLDWILTFTQSGTLLRVRHTQNAGLVEKAVPAGEAEVKSVPLKESAIELPAPSN